MIVVIDHEDSFVHTLARYVGLCGKERMVIRHNEIDVAGIAALNPEAIILSPGPCGPEQTDVTIPLIRALGPSTPILGVCLGHQAIGAAFGATIERCPPCHGKTSLIHHDGHVLFNGLPNPFAAARYHSLHVTGLENTELTVIARNDEGLVMGLAHRRYPVYGVQFHPESCLTENGLRIIENFLIITETSHGSSMD